MQEVHLFTNSQLIRKATEEALTGVLVVTHPIGVNAANRSSNGAPVHVTLPHLRLGLAGTPVKADAIITTGKDSGTLQRYAMGKGTPYVIILPDAAEWFSTQVAGRGMSVLIGSDAARLWA